MTDAYQVIMADPPWCERGGGRIKRGADRHYDLIPTKELPRVFYDCELYRPADHAILALWATMSHLPDAMWLIETLGFTYISNLVWIKDRPGLGQYIRGRHEHLLLAKRGRPMPRIKASRVGGAHVSSVIEERRRLHSQKPTLGYAAVEEIWPSARRLNMFAVEDREGWDKWAPMAHR